MGVSLLTDRQALGLAVIAGLVVWYGSRKAGQVVNAVSPFNNENIFIEGVEGLAGEDTVATVGDYVFGGFSLLNPWADETEKNYARGIYGLNDESN